MNIVEKYGGSSVADIDKIKAIAKHVADMKKAGHNMIVVASAMGKTTNKLIAMAQEIGEHVSPREMDSLLSTGEQRSVTLLAMAIEAQGVPAISLTGFQCGFITSDHHAQAKIKDIEIANVQKHLDAGKVVVVAGFQGASEQGEITTLGRGGSDTTAVALAAKLGWECHIYTDVLGVYTIDPRIYPHAKRLKAVTYNEMMQMACGGSGVLETRSVELASKYQVVLYLGKALEANKAKGTYIMKVTNLEDMPITGIGCKDDYSMIRVNDLPLDGEYIARLFHKMANLNIVVDTISQQLTHDEKVNFSFSCDRLASDMLSKHLPELEEKYPITRMLGFVKLSLVGVGMSTRSGIAAKVLQVLCEHKVRYYLVTSSEICISLTIEEKDKKVAIEALAKAFDL